MMNDESVLQRYVFWGMYQAHSIGIALSKGIQKLKKTSFRRKL
jgi:hypothetical protein